MTGEAFVARNRRIHKMIRRIWPDKVGPISIDTTRAVDPRIYVDHVEVHKVERSAGERAVQLKRVENSLKSLAESRGIDLKDIE